MSNKGGKSGKHPTAGEKDDRIEFTLRQIATGKYKSDIKRALRERYGNLCARTCERYITAAFEITMLEMKRPAEELAAEAVAFYDGIIANQELSIFVRMRARERKDKLLGLEKPIKHDVSGNLKVNADVAVNGAPMPSLEEIKADLAEAESLLSKGRKKK